MFKHTRFSALVMSVMMCVGSLQTPVWAANDLAGAVSIEANAPANRASNPTTTVPLAAVDTADEAVETAIGAAAETTANETAAEATAAEKAAAVAEKAAAAAEAAAAEATAAEKAAAATKAGTAAQSADEATPDTTAAAGTDTDQTAGADTNQIAETDLPLEAVIGATSTADNSTTDNSDTTTPEVTETPTPTPTPGGTWNNIVWSLAADNTRLVISGSGEMPDATDAPWQTDEYRNTITEIRTGNYITSIGANAFTGFSKLTTLKIGLRIRTIGASAFEKCIGLSTINNTSNRLTTIGERAFADCETLTEPLMPETLLVIEKQAFYSCSNIRTVFVPDCVKTIGDAAFAYGAGVNHAFISSTVTTVGKNIFRGCDGPMSAVVDSYLVGEGMFRDCSGLYDLTIGSDVIGIGMYAFKNCTSLKEVMIPGGASAISDNAFEGCLSLEEVTMEEGITHICKHAFYNSGVVNISIPSTVEFIGKYAFANCSELKTVNLSSNALTEIPEYAFSRDLRLTDVTLGEELVTIGNNAFEHCSSLVRINFPGKLETIGKEAFIYDYALKTIDLGNSVKEIGSKAFYSCSNLAKVTVGRSLETIGAQAFAFCIPLVTFNVHSRNVQYTGDEVFRNSPVTMYGYYGSTSETYAKNHNITFESITNMGAPTLRVCSSVRTGVSLKWYAVSGAVNYSIYRQASDETTETLVTTTKSLSYLDTGITSGKVYTYYIVADDGVVSSERSEKRTVAFVPAPKSVSLTNALAGAQVAWTAVDNADKYIIYRKTASTGYEIIAKVSSSTLKYYDERAVSGTVYTYAVATYIEKFGNEVRNVTGAMRETRTYMRLTTPTIASVTSPSAGTLVVSWGRLSTARGYQVRYTTDPYFKKDVTSVTVAGKNQLTRTFTGLQSGKTYYVRVLCYQKDSTRYYYSGNSLKKSVKIK